MNLFIGWSGDRSKQLALELRNWFPKVVQAVIPWMSERDINAGARWLVELVDQLEKTNFGVVVLTSDILREPWIHFEAGALAKQLKGSAVCPYLIDIPDKSAVVGPLAQFQMKHADRKDTLSLVRNINFCLADSKLSDEILDDTFARFWPDLERAISTLPAAAVKVPERSERELLEEILETVRSLDRRSSQPMRLTRNPFPPTGSEGLHGKRPETDSDAALKVYFDEALLESRFSGRDELLEKLRDLLNRRPKDVKPRGRKNGDDEQDD